MSEWTEKEIRALNFLVSQGENVEEIARLLKNKTKREIKEKCKELDL